MKDKPDHGLTAANTTSALGRSPLWPGVQKSVLKKTPKCFACESRKGLQVHHIHPFHYCVGVGRPDLELDERNLIALCETDVDDKEENHHLLIGHGGDFKLFNSHVLEDAKAWYGLKAQVIRESASFKERQAHKPKEFKDMTYDEKKAYRDLLDRELPFKASLGFRWPEPIVFDQVVNK